MYESLNKKARERRLIALASLQDHGGNVISLARRRADRAVSVPTLFVSRRPAVAQAA